MKTILCYGDSNTWGKAATKLRLPRDRQWVNVLQAKLGQDYDVVQEGLSARIAGSYETEKPWLNGQDPFVAIFLSAVPLDVVVIALGTNDLKTKYNQNPQGVVDNLLWYKTSIMRLAESNSGVIPHVIYVLPPNFQDGHYFPGDQNLRRDIITEFQKQAPGEQAIIFNDLEMSEDGVHFTTGAHERVAEAIHEKVKELNI